MAKYVKLIERNKAKDRAKAVKRSLVSDRLKDQIRQAQSSTARIFQQNNDLLQATVNNPIVPYISNVNSKSKSISKKRISNNFKIRKLDKRVSSIDDKLDSLCTQVGSLVKALNSNSKDDLVSNHAKPGNSGSVVDNQVSDNDSDIQSSYSVVSNRGGENSVVSNRGDEVASGYEVSSLSKDTIPPSDHEQTNINANFDSLMTREGVWDYK